MGRGDCLMTKDEEIKKLKEKVKELEDENTTMKYAIYILNKSVSKKWATKTKKQIFIHQRKICFPKYLFNF